MDAIPQFEVHTISTHAPKNTETFPRKNYGTLKWNSVHLSLRPPLAFSFNELFSVKFQQPIYFIIKFGKGKKGNCCLINYFQLLFLIKCMVSLLCKGGCVATMLFYHCRHTHWVWFYLLHPRIYKKHDAEQQSKAKFGKEKYRKALLQWIPHKDICCGIGDPVFAISGVCASQIFLKATCSHR